MKCFTCYFRILALALAWLSGTHFCASTVRGQHPSPEEYTAFPAVCVATQPAVAAQPVGESCILMRNRSVMNGKITDADNGYLIQIAGGSIQVAASQVWKVGRDYDELYVFLKEQLHVTDVEQRSELVRWCLKYELVDQADTEIAELEQMVPGSPLLNVLKMRRDATVKTLVTRQVTTSVYSGENARMPPASSHDRAMTTNELNQMAKTLPRDAVDIFNKRVHSILIQNCTASGCHGPDGTSDFKLLRPSSHAGGSVSLRNMHAALQQINLTTPEASPLLRKPVTRHGKDGRVVFINRDYATYQLLIAWVYLVAKNEYVIPRERMLPPAKSAPVLCPTPQGLEPVAAGNRQTPHGVSRMFGVDESLYPQNLYPSEYSYLYTSAQSRVNPAARFQKSPPQAPASPGTETVNDLRVRQAGYAEAPYDDLETLETEEEEEPVHVLEVQEVQRNGTTQYVQPPKMYTPGVSTENVQYGQRENGLMAAPQPDMRPQSPMELLMGVQNGVMDYSENTVQYDENYGKSVKKNTNTGQNAFFPWKAGLEMQRALEAQEAALNGK